MPVVRTHFSSSSVRGFPEYLLHNLYDVDSDGSLKPATRHVRGQALVDIVEVQRWSSSAARISQIFGAAGIAVNGIDVSGFRDADGSVLTNLIASLRNSLVKIEMSRCFANQPTIISALSSVEHLTSLNVADNPLLIDDDAIFLLMRNLNQLTVLDISGCTFLSDKSLMSIANSCGCQLKSLSSRRNHLITDSAANQVLMKCECLEFLDFSCCPKLKMLRVLTCCGGNVPMFVSRSLNCVILDNCPNLSAESFDWLCASNANLTRLSIMDAKSMLESSLLGLIFSCCNLVQLNLKGCSGVTGKVLRTIADKCRRLSDLSIARLGLDTSSFDVRNLLLGTGSSCLDRLDISGNVNLGDDVFALSVHNAAKDRLNLTWLNVAKCCLSGQGVSTLAERCPSLRHLDISDVKGVTDAAVRTIVESCKQLRELWMDDCPSVTNRAVIAIAYGLPKLFSLHLSSSSDLTQDSFGDTIRHYQYSDDAVEALLDGSRSLQDLSLRNQNGVCFASPWFAKSFPKRAGHFRLQKLDLFGVDNLNVRGAMAVFRHCSDLSEVILSRRLPSTFRTRKFWESCFSKAAYTMNYEDTKHLAKATAAQSRLRVAESELCHVERDADVVLKRAQTRESKLPTDSPVRSMSFSGANQVSPTGAEVMQQKQRDADRISRFSMDNVDGGERALTPPSSPLKGKRRRSVQEEVLAIEDHKSKRANAPHLLLRPHAQAAALRYRDMYVRMRLLENYSASIIKRKWKCHALWSKIRLKVCARRIAKWYKGLLDTRRRKKLKNHLHYVGRAKSIQRVFRVYLSLLWHAAISIQRISRGGRARTNLKNQTKRRIASTRIQSWTRGWLARLSDRCALSRLYLLLPPFWRLILHSVPFAQTDNTVSSIVPMRGSGESAISNSADATFERNRNHTHAVNNIRTAHIGDEEVSMADIIGMRQTVDLMTSKKNSLLPSDSELQRRGGGRARLPFRIPQSFDEASYYSLDDGRHIPITGVQKAIAMADGSPGHHPGNGTNAQPPMHLYGLKLWPVDGTTHAYDRKSLLVFNPHNDNMKTGLAGAREALLCLTCNRHLSLLYCETCMKGFCFTCMFRVHALNSKRGHQVTLLEPRVTLQASEENTDTCRSLTYHMVLANEASHLIRYFYVSLSIHFYD